jgi:hypothetical protein
MNAKKTETKKTDKKKQLKLEIQKLEVVVAPMARFADLSGGCEYRGGW